MKIKNLTEFKKAVENIFKKIKINKKEATVILLSGDLGAGKTTMTQIIGKKLGIKKTIQSPTFVLIRKYKLKNKDYEFMFHIDAYRLESEKEIEKLNFKEIISSPKNLVLIEWPEKISKILPKKVKKIKIKHIKEGREIIFSL